MLLLGPIMINYWCLLLICLIRFNNIFGFEAQKKPAVKVNKHENKDVWTKRSFKYALRHNGSADLLSVLLISWSAGWQLVSDQKHKQITFDWTNQFDDFKEMRKVKKIVFLIQKEFKVNFIKDLKTSQRHKVKKKWRKNDPFLISSEKLCF